MPCITLKTFFLTASLVHYKNIHIYDNTFPYSRRHLHVYFKFYEVFFTSGICTTDHKGIDTVASIYIFKSSMAL